MIEEEYGTPDEDNPEWTKEDFARSIKFKDLPESLQRTLSSIQRKRTQKQIPCGDDKQESKSDDKRRDS
jgi:hypothetical protein